MMFGLRQKFTYLECSGCGVLLLANPAHNLSDHYPKDYYSFATTNGLTKKLKSFGLSLGRLGLRRLIHSVLPMPTVDLIYKLDMTPGMKILDVGGGSGKLAKELRQAGFHHALCIDPFTSQETPYCRKITLSELEGTWDRIMFHHSFEHIEDQLGTLIEVRNKLSPKGLSMIQVPVASWAWRHYGVDWVQLDAPRHMCIHTPASMRRAAQLAGLNVRDMKSDSGAFQFWGSELYRRNIPLIEGQRNLSKYFDAKTMKKYAAESKALNASGEGDQATFIITAI
ncbi:MAG: class I SAM-dependent methyltransferase [Acidobacteriia bacterium]|nr:class I SAM-dependent methyltransferase [Terriglobia bacterium]